MTTVAILSDTHGLLREEVKEQLTTADVIIHAGDINTMEIVEQLRSIAPLYVVQGNNDKEWAKELPHCLQFEIEGVRIYLVHNKKDIPKDIRDVDVIIYGHSHRYDDKIIEGFHMFNPGSCGKRRFDLEITMAIMHVDDRNYKIEKIVIPHTYK